MTITLCYWGVRGLGEPSRYILRYSETEWIDDALVPGKESYVAWLAKKHTMGLDLPNLPYLLDGDVKVTQSLAIVRYLARKLGLVPEEAGLVRCDMAEQEIMDLRTAFGRLCYSPDFEDKKAAYLENLDKKLEVFDRFLGAGPFLMGEKITYVDFLAYEFIDQIKKLAPENVGKAKNVSKFLETFEKLPTLQKFFNSEEHKNGKYVNSPMSAFPGK